MGAGGTQSDEDADRQQCAHRERGHWTPPMARWDAIYALARLTANPSPVNRHVQVDARFDLLSHADLRVHAGRGSRPGPRHVPRRAEPGHGRDPRRRPRVQRRPGWFFFFKQKTAYELIW